MSDDPKNLISLNDFKLSKLIAENYDPSKTKLNLIRAVFWLISDENLEDIADEIMVILYNHFDLGDKDA